MSSAGSSPTPLSRALRRLLTPVSRRLALAGHDRSFTTAASGGSAASGLRLFMIVLPGGEELARRNASTLAGHCRLSIVLNGYSRNRADHLAGALPAESVIRLETVPGFPVRHGTALTLLLRRAGEDFAILDPDCFIRDPRLVEPLTFRSDEFLAAPDHPHFYNVNPATGERFPRTHFLIANRRSMLGVMSRHGITAEKYVRAPARLEVPLRKLGYGSHNYPRTYLRHFDTLLLVMTMALHDGLRVRWLKADASRVHHLKHQGGLGLGIDSEIAGRSD